VDGERLRKAANSAVPSMSAAATWAAPVAAVEITRGKNAGMDATPLLSYLQRVAGPRNTHHARTAAGNNAPQGRHAAGRKVDRTRAQMQPQVPGTARRHPPCDFVVVEACTQEVHVPIPAGCAKGQQPQHGRAAHTNADTHITNVAVNVSV
jgi:hypothetical protein